MDTIQKFTENCIQHLKPGAKAAVTCGSKVIVVYKDAEFHELFDLHTYIEQKVKDDVLGCHKDDLMQEINDIVYNIRPLELIS